LLFEVEPYLPNIGLRSIWNTKNNGNDDHGSGAPKDSEMEEAQNHGKAINSGASAATIVVSSNSGKEANNPEARMDVDFEEDDLLDEGNDLSDAVRNFVGVKRGHSVDVRVAASLVPSGSSAPAHMQQRSSQSSRSEGKLVPGNLMKGKEKGQQQPPSAGIQASAGLGAASWGSQKIHNQQPSTLVGESLEASQVDGTSDGVLVGEEQYLGAGPEAMVEAGVSADGNVLGSVMTMAVLSDGELTPVR